MSYKLKKKSNLETAMTGKKIGGEVPSAATFNSLGGDIGTASKVESSSLKGVDISALAKLRAAKKKPVEEAQAPREEREEMSEARIKYQERLRKRAR